MFLSKLSIRQNIFLHINVKLLIIGSIKPNEYKNKKNKEIKRKKMLDNFTKFN